jgi:hypothetical protein
MAQGYRFEAEAGMERIRTCKVEFEQAHPDDWDAFNGWAALPVPVTRTEAVRGLRKARRLGRVLVEGPHRYRLIGSNTVILRPR